MKKINIRTFLLSALAILSITSYVYLTSVPTCNTSVNTTEIEEVETKVYLPDVDLIQKIFKTGKKIIL